MDEAVKAAKRREFSERMRDPSFQRVLAATAAWFLAWAVVCAFLRHPGEMLVAALTLTWILRTFLIALMHRLHRVPALRGALEAMAADPAERGYTSRGTPMGLWSTLFLQALLLGPLMALGIWGMQRQSEWTLAMWGVFVAKDLLWKGIYLKFDEPLHINYDYNSLWMIGGILVIACLAVLGPVALVAAFVARMLGVGHDLGGWMDQFWVQYLLAILILVPLHLKDLLERIARWKLARGLRADA